MVGLLQGKLMDVSRRQYTSKKSGNEVNLYTIILYDEDGYKDSEKFFTATINSKLMDADKLLAQKDALMGKPVELTGTWKVFQGERKFEVSKVRSL
jgi:hypothetical protein